MGYLIRDSQGRGIAKIFLGFIVEEINKKDLLETINPLLLSLGIAIQRLQLIADLQNKEKELDALNTELKLQDESKDSFIAALAHDLRAPLNSIMGWAEIYKSFSDESQREEAIDSIHRAGNKQLRLITDLLDISRIRSGKFHINKSPTDLVQLISQTVKSYQITAKEKQVALDFQSSPKSQITEVDSDRIEQVIANLLDNAFKFTEKGGKISVSIGHGQDVDNCDISIKDDGIGMSEEVREQIFTKHYQKQSMSRRGLGLGLTIVQEILKGHGAYITAHSEGQGCGSEFRIHLPYSTVKKKSSESKKLEPQPGPAAIYNIH